MSRRKPCLHTLQDHSAAPHLFFLNELVGEYLESNEWILFAGNEGDHLIDLVKTITKEGLVPLHL
jgi:hypothetical protein